VISDNTPCYIAKVVQAQAEELGIELVALPGYSPDLNPIERLRRKARAAEKLYHPQTTASVHSQSVDATTDLSRSAILRHHQKFTSI
jgi:transposase